ncbi:MAG TPA: UPF0280 family protein, partial [bacterium]|nr:UPF0280 family protein [bacterium]
MKSRFGTKYSKRFYRDRLPDRGLVAFSVVFEETDLYILAESDLGTVAEQCVRYERACLEEYLARDSGFLNDLKPRDPRPEAPELVLSMCEAARLAGVGPMAAVAGAIAQSVGRKLCAQSGEVLVENGGDIFVKTVGERTIALYAGVGSPFSMCLGLRIFPDQTPLGVCTSSGTVGHSLSFGKSDASVVVARDAALADATATALGNRIQSAKDIEPAFEWIQTVPGISGA